jgi:hypothetical protein
MTASRKGLLAAVVGFNVANLVACVVAYMSASILHMAVDSDCRGVVVILAHYLGASGLHLFGLTALILAAVTAAAFWREKVRLFAIAACAGMAVWIAVLGAGLIGASLQLVPMLMGN